MKHQIGKGVKMIKLLGFYRRETDNTEYVFYEKDGKNHLTNGIMDWGDKSEIYVTYPGVKKVDSIDKEVMISRLKRFYPFSGVIRLLSEQSGK